VIIYFDTSLLVAYYTTEERTDEASAIVAQATLPVVSDLGVAEMNVVMKRKVQEGYLDSEGAATVFALFDEHLQDVFFRLPIEASHVAETRDLPDRTGIHLRTLDALHLALAEETGGVIATFDHRLAGAARALGFVVLPEGDDESPP